MPDQILAEHQALARAVVALAARVTGQAGPDGLRAMLGTDTALAVLDAAGADTPSIQARWEAAAPAWQQVPQRRQSDVFDIDPMHHPAVVLAQVRDGDVTGAMREVAADMSNPARAQRASMALDFMASGRMTLADAIEAASAQIARSRYERQGGQPVPMGVSAGPDSRPVQRSAVHAGVPALGSEV
jgi:hypothetical protein